jgi:pimeloyl-ACP methyl ester carboxylesterase
MSAVELRRAGPFAYSEALPDRDPSPTPVFCLHGFPETSWMWREVLSACADAGIRAIAMDRPGCGRSEADPPATWTRQVDAVERFAVELDLPPVILVVHDWGGLIGLRWACDHPERIRGLVISSTGFFPDGKWHGMAQGLRAPGTGEELIEGMNRESFGGLMHSVGSGFDEEAIDEYWLSFGTEEGRAGILEMYRSGNFEELIPYEGKLAGLGVPTLLLWGESDEFAPVASAHRLAMEIPGSELKFVQGAGHFLYSDAPDEAAEAVAGFATTVS